MKPETSFHRFMDYILELGLVPNVNAIQVLIPVNVMQNFI